MGLVPSWVKEAKPKVQPANARCETLKTNGMFRGAHRLRRSVLFGSIDYSPIDC